MRTLPPHPETLYVVAVISNPQLYVSRAKLANEFVARMKGTPYVHLITVEMTFGGRLPQLVNKGDTHLEVNGTDQIWSKENLANLGLQKLPPGAKFAGWCDMDIQFLEPDWALRTLHALEAHRVVMPWTSCIDEGPNGEIVQIHKSFASQYVKGAPMSADSGSEGYESGIEFPHPGYATFYRKDVLDKIGGFPDWTGLGAGDHILAKAFIGDVKNSLPGGIHPNYAKLAYQLQDRCEIAAQRDLGAVEGSIRHFHHGRKRDRQYVSRWKILIDNAYDPEVDIIRNTAGVIHLAGNKPKLRDDIRKYLASRNEDSLDLE